MHLKRLHFFKKNKQTPEKKYNTKVAQYPEKKIVHTFIGAFATNTVT